MKSKIARVLRKSAQFFDRSNGDTQSFIDASSEYTRWLYYAVPGMTHKGNLYCIDYAIQHLPSSAPLLEIGSFSGLSTNLITYFKLKRNRKNLLFTCDRWEFETADLNEIVGDSQISHLDYQTFVKESYIRNVKMFSQYDLPFTIEMLSDEFFLAWRQSKHTTDIFNREMKLGGAISFCYIDGNHSYEFVKRDFENCHEFLESGGFILFDDSADGLHFGVTRLVAEICQMSEYRLVVKNPHYLFQKN